MKPIQSDELTLVASIDQVSKLLDVPKSTLRYYDRNGIIQSKRHEDKDNSYRIYTRQDILTLFDFLLYRNLDISVKDIQDMNSLPIEARYNHLLKLIEENQQKIQDLMKANNELLHNLSVVQKYMVIKDRGYHITETIEIDHVNEFHVLEPEHIQQWIQEPFSKTYTILCDAAEPDKIYEGISNVNNYDSPYIWEAAKSSGKYVECLTWTNYASPYHNNIHDHLQWLKEHDLRAGKIICLFLIPILDEETNQRRDVYHTWIELL